MSKIYKIISGHNIEVLETRVNEELSKGGELIGGLCRFDNRSEFYQAMIINDDGNPFNRLENINNKGSKVEHINIKRKSAF